MRTTSVGRADEGRRWWRVAAGPDGVRSVLGLLARRLSAEVVLVGTDEGQTVAVGTEAGRVVRMVGRDLDRVRTGEVDAATVHADGYEVAVLPVGRPPARAVLVAARPGALSAEHRDLLATVVDPLWLSWRTAIAERRAERLDAADAEVRESVLHLLMVGHLSGARRTAAVLRPPLPDLARVYLIASRPGSRDALSRRCREVFGAGAWVVPCPVYGRHVIVIAPDEPAPPDRLFGELAGAAPGTRLGVGLRVALREVAAGYKQAFHALAMAHHRPEGYARFAPRGELGELLGPDGRAWAAATLAPLLAYRPPRPQDPDAAELLATLVSWLDFGARAAAQLKIHRNTLTARLDRIGAELRRDLGRFATRAELYLALQLVDDRPDPGTATEVVEYEALLDHPEVRHWAGIQLAPLLPADRRVLLATARAWFEHDLRTGPVATALGISAHGLRKRLARIEELLGRALLVGPSVRYDLYHALRVHPGSAR